MGLLSVTDAILDRPMEQVLASLPIAPEVRAALCGSANQHRDVYDVLLAYERADWPTVSPRIRPPRHRRIFRRRL